jgi:hypothetical protein
MLSQIAEWAAAVLAAGMVAGLVVVVAGAAGVWWLYRRARRRLEGVTAIVARYALQGAAGAAAAGRGRLPLRVMPGVGQRAAGPPGVR